MPPDGRVLPGDETVTVEGVNVFGPVEVASGLGNAVRGHLRAMWDAGLRTRIFPFRFDSRQGEQQFRYAEESAFYDLSLVYANPDATDFVESIYGDEIRRSKRKVGIWVWELPAAPVEHAARTRRYDEIWVPSNFNRRAYFAVTKTPVHVVPYVVEPAKRSAVDFRTRLGMHESAFVFLYMLDASSFVERKNPLALLRAFGMEFDGEPDVFLVLKVSNLNAASPFAEDLDVMRCVIGNLRVIQETFDESDVTALLCAADCYVSPHRSEGFGFTLAEAMALGKPVVATDYGSTCDFVRDGTGFPVRPTLVEIDADLGPYRGGAVWADTAAADLALEMRRVIRNPAEARRRSEAGRKLVQNRFSRQAIGRHIAERVQAVLHD
jgi:glycosyltransferase involved in cell wall biosynthesis